MTFVRLPSIVLRVIAPAMRLWWRIRRPATFGVKAFLTHGDSFLVVRHSYSDTARWGLPGGGYRPGRETPAAAVAREVQEELGIIIDAADFTILDTTVTTLEGKKDTLTILAAPAPNRSLSLSPELAEARWITDTTDLDNAPTSRWLLKALEHAGETTQNHDSPGSSSRI